MRILFITRVYPPTIGGLENQSFNTIKYFSQINGDIFAIINRGGKKNLPFFIFYAFFKALYLIKKNKITHLHLSDGVLAPLGYLLKKIVGVKTAITISGLDITYANYFYQKIVPQAVKKLDAVLCLSQNTIKECVKRGIRQHKTHLVYSGIDSRAFALHQDKEILKKNISEQYHVALDNKKILLTTGRLIKRKGVTWFIDEVMPKLDNNFMYLVAGAGPEKENIENVIKSQGIQNKIALLGSVNNETLKKLYNIADLFIMPNISIKNDVEGFGLVAIEAGSCGVTTIASQVDSLPDAIIEGQTGWLVPEKNASIFIEKIKGPVLDKNIIIKTVREKFDWSVIIQNYYEIIARL